MRTIISDIDLNFNEGDIVIREAIYNCVGCFKCWVKHPFKCCMKDNIQYNGKTLYDSDELVIISKCVNGSYSSSVKRILERSISYVEPCFGLRYDEVHHMVRSDKKLDFKIIFYGDIDPDTKEIARALAHANMKNLNTKRPEVIFFKTKEEIEANL